MRTRINNRTVSLLAVALGAAVWLFAAIVLVQTLMPGPSCGYTWRTAEIPRDKRWRLVDSIAVSPKGSVFVGRESSGVFRSDDGGQHWKHCISGMKDCSVDAVAVDARGTVFAGTGRGIYRSVDNGKTWALANKGLPACSVLTLATDSRGRTYAGSQDGAVYESPDSTVHWKRIRGGVGEWDYVKSLGVTHKGVIFCTEKRGLWRSADGGDHWINLTPEWSTGKLHESGDAIAVDSQDRVYVAVYLSEYLGEGKSKTESFIMRSDDHGTHWTRLYPGAKKLRCSAVAVNAQGHVIAGTERGLYISLDHGASWRDVNASLSSRIKQLLKGGDYIPCVTVDSRGAVYAVSRFTDVISGVPIKTANRSTR